MAKTVLRVPFGKGYQILKDGNLIERAALAKRYPFVAAASPVEILMAIQSITLRQVENQLKNFMAEGNRIGTSRTPSLSEFATIVEDNVSEDDEDAEETTQEEPAPKQAGLDVEADLEEEFAKPDAEEIALRAEAASDVPEVEEPEVETETGFDPNGAAAFPQVPVDDDGKSPEDIVLEVQTGESVEDDTTTHDCRLPGCESGPFNSERGRNIHETKAHGDYELDTDTNTLVKKAAVDEEPAEPTSISDAIAQREETAASTQVGAVEQDDEEDDLLAEIMSGNADDDDEFETDAAPATEPTAETETDDEGDKFLEELGILDI